MRHALKLFAVCIPLSLATPALADKIQILKDGAYVAYATYEIGTARGRTDRYGRLSVNLPKGPYKGKIQYRGRQYTVDIKITGARGLRKVFLKP